MATASSASQLNVSHIFAEAKRLFPCKLYRSVETLGLLCISQISKSEILPSTKHISNNNSNITLTEVYELVGDAIYQQRQVKRALAYYQLAIQNKPPLGIKVAQVNRPATWVKSTTDALLLLKTAQCSYDLGDTATAIIILESIPPAHIELTILTTLAQWYQAASRADDALRLYKQAYALAPYALEILEIIMAMKTEESEATKLLKEYHTKQYQEQVVISQSTTQSENSGIPGQLYYSHSILKTPPEWMQHLIFGLHHHHRYESEKALEYLQRLVPIFPKNVFILQLTAQAWSLYEIDSQAISLYRQILRLDTSYIHQMDKYSALIYRSASQNTVNFYGKEDEMLHFVATTLMDASSAMAPEALLSVAYYCLWKKEYDAALSFVEKAMTVSQGRHVEAWRCRGLLRSLSSLPTMALTDYVHANNLAKDMVSFVGIVETNMHLKKFRDAATAAKEMVLLYPRSARALYTLGTVMAKSTQGVRESIKAYSKALRLHPRLLDATLALCATYLALGHNGDAEHCAREALKHESHPKVLNLLAKALSNQEKYTEALDQLRLSCSLTSTTAASTNLYQQTCLEEATAEIERIETILRDENGAILQQEQEELDLVAAANAVEEEEGDIMVEEEEEGEEYEDYAYSHGEEGEDSEGGIDGEEDSALRMGVRRGQLFGGQDDDDNDDDV